MIPSQLLGFHNGLRKSLDPHQPRRLARIVMLDSGYNGEPDRGEP
jgi:glucosamine 6-phosphate synthetase-like amidotransferase/phosphosugar isomerase protein